MLRLLPSIRRFRREKRSFIINLTGLSTGLACTILIFLWVWDEVQIDGFHAQDKQLYHVLGNHQQGDAISTWNGTPIPLGELLESEIPEVVQACSATDPAWQMEFRLTQAGNQYGAVGKFVDESYFNLFSYPLLEGVGDSLLTGINSVVISETLALQLFGKATGVIGQQLDWQFQQLNSPAIVSGVFTDIPANSTDQFDFVLPFSLYRKVFGEGWENPNAITYILLDPQSDLDQVNQKISAAHKARMPEAEVEYFLQSYSDQYLFGAFENGSQAGGRITNVRWFSWLALFILAIACINFINLSTAKSIQRARTVGIRKALGAGRWSLIKEYFGEAVVLTNISIVFALFGVYLLLPYFNQFTGKSLELDFSWPLIFALLSIGFFTSLLAGTYPAIYTSSFPAITVAKGRSVRQKGRISLRESLVTGQFALSIIMIVGVLVLSKQMNFLQKQSLGYERENLIRFSTSASSTGDVSSFLSEIKRLPGVVQASAMTNGFFELPGGELSWDGQGDKEVSFNRHIVDYNFVETLGIEVLEGRSFDKEFAEGPQIILNETAVKAMGLSSPVGTRAKFWGQEVSIVGVVKDFNFRSLHEEIGPMFFQLSQNFLNQAIVRLKSDNLAFQLEQLSNIYEKFNPGQAFTYHFIDEDYQQLYGAEERMSGLGRYFAALAILISCLGLLGLIFFMTEGRKKEISIRKVLGSSTAELIRLLSFGFSKMILVAALIAVPISYYLAASWLGNFAYRIELEWWYFILAILIGVSLSYITIFRQIFQTANLNPAEVLRRE
ncbi:MAG: ABC transporter permease [Saprospiraceae bacterium]|nr:ABC transporter permease [Saprospiraceae bacterium]